MFLSDDNTALVRELILNFYSQPFDEALLMQTARILCRLMGGDHYFALLLTSHGSNNHPVVISNNPPEFIPSYLSVADKDFLLGSVLQNGQEYILGRTNDLELPENQDFNHAGQSVRPISDVIYIPIKNDNYLVGCWCLARAGLKSPLYLDSELDVFRFVASFLTDAFSRSLIPPPLEDDIAYLDYQGYILVAGAGIKCWLGLLSSAQRTAFLHAYQNFLHGYLKPRMDRVTLCIMDTYFDFQFRLLRPTGLPLHRDGLPFASAQMLNVNAKKHGAQLINLSCLAQRYELTRREQEVIRGIYQGHSNKVIAHHLGIDESTVKTHTHNIYEKTGCKSRVELVLNLGMES